MESLVYQICFAILFHVNHGAMSKSNHKIILQQKHNNIHSQQRLSVQAGEELCGAKADVVRLQQIMIQNHNTFRHSTAGLTFSPPSQFDQNVSLHQQMVTVVALASRMSYNKSPRRDMEGMKRAGHIVGAKHLCKQWLKGPRMWELRPPVALVTLRTL